ncbi:beta-ribofuranosylaminobenzene 5'-phosphate synthase family protein [Pseudoalteromonas piratica]|uniref:GHMP kinase N-terminal domain-containing protein n=1 Tax=Pseudoalteromonas piratica TaxID=1348114 RepID=A0A0A7EBR0_9GAMM|nr:beta-ribofuranosylaminobenzene 5'-phosphate synthase family protein [Pseudoalteromonas piratica]AIY63943.1 hypothetical protein OM33_01310 [Pseudoalteromonas piratica]
MQKITIKVPLRLHFNLIALHECQYRRNGGFGLAVDSGFMLKGKRSNKISFEGEYNELSKTIEKVTIKLEQISKELSLLSGIKISLIEPPKPHIGLGSGTALTLASIEALLIVNNYEYDHNTIQKLSGRGGTSGVGIHSYFTGGMVFDTGVPPENRPHNPSSYVEPISIPTLLFKKDYPFGDIRFLYPCEQFKNFGNLEADFFEENTPISKSASLEACYNTFFMVAAALADKQILTFSKAVDAIRKTAWKMAEIQHCGSKIQNIFTSLEEKGVQGTSMSSMGPGIFIVSKGKSEEIEEIKAMYKLNELRLTPNNNGRKLNYV